MKVQYDLKRKSSINERSVKDDLTARQEVSNSVCRNDENDILVIFMSHHHMCSSRTESHLNSSGFRFPSLINTEETSYAEVNGHPGMSVSMYTLSYIKHADISPQAPAHLQT